MRILNTVQNDFEQRLGELRSALLPERLILDSRKEYAAVEAIVDRVRIEGDAALCDLTERLDSVRMAPARIAVSDGDLTRAEQALGAELRRAIESAAANVRRYQEHIKVRQPPGIRREGIELKTRYRPIERVGIYVPAGTAPLFSSLVMTAVPARVAGVRQIVVCSAPRYGGDIHPVILAVCRMLGIDEVYRVGGAQAIAAMALGTATIRKVDKIVGPGNLYVQLAKKAVFGIVDIESLAGPSEIVVLADGTANPRYVAADMIGQAEHDPGSAILVTPCPDLPERVEQELERLLGRSERSERTRRCLDDYSAMIVAESLPRAVEVVNRIAPEHLSVQTDRPDEVAEACTNAGAIFVGPYTSEAIGDYLAGPSHVLPTGGTARFFSPLNVMDFMRHTSVIRYDRSALREAFPAIEAMTDAEQLPGHRLSAEVRLED